MRQTAEVKRSRCVSRKTAAETAKDWRLFVCCNWTWCRAVAPSLRPQLCCWEQHSLPCTHPHVHTLIKTLSSKQTATSTTCQALEPQTAVLGPTFTETRMHVCASLCTFVLSLLSCVWACRGYWERFNEPAGFCLSAGWTSVDLPTDRCLCAPRTSPRTSCMCLWGGHCSSVCCVSNNKGSRLR